MDATGRVVGEIHGDTQKEATETAKTIVEAEAVFAEARDRVALDEDGTTQGEETTISPLHDLLQALEEATSLEERCALEGDTGVKARFRRAQCVGMAHRAALDLATFISPDDKFRVLPLYLVAPVGSDTPLGAGYWAVPRDGKKHT